MSKFRPCFVAAVLCSLILLGHGQVTQKGAASPVAIHETSQPSSSQNVSNPEVITIDVPPKSTTTEPVDKKPTTESKTTVTPATTTTTPATTTTTPATTTTTPSTTTSTIPPTTTSTTTTTPPPPPTPKPTPAPAPTPVGPPEHGKWSFQANNITCVMIQFAAQFNVTYITGSNATSVLVNIPANATVVGGGCGASEQWLTLSWPCHGSPATVTFNFLKNTTKEYELKNLTASFPQALFVNSSITTNVSLLADGATWVTPLASSYRCPNPVTVNLTAAQVTGAVASLSLNQLQEEAFRGSNNTEFSSAHLCEGADVPDTVPIAVGCALGGLVLVVLVAYLVGRRRSQARGYLSM